MVTTEDVSQLFAAQNQMFSAQMAFASRIGPSTPGNIGSYGYPGVGGINPGTPFSYGSVGAGQAFGNRAAAGIMSGVAGAGAIGSGAIGAASLFSLIPRPLAPLMDPFAAFGMARAAGAGIAGGIGAAMVPIGLGIAAGAGINAFVRGGQQMAGVQTTLSNFNFANSQAPTGQGFTRQDAGAITDVVRTLSNLPEMMTSIGELTRIMGRLRSTSLMQGVHDATEFASRFKEAIASIRDTARILGTSMEEAEKFFAHSRSVGFLGRADQLRNAVNVQVTSGLTGMSIGEVMQTQTAGANLAQTFGARRVLGARAVTNIGQDLGIAQRNNLLERGLLEDLTGVEGPQAVGLAANQIAGSLMKLSMGTQAGTALTLGLTHLDERGRASIDPELARRFAAGEISASELRQMGSRNAGNRQLAMSFSARRENLAADLAGRIGPGGMGRLVNSLVGGRFGSEGATLLMRQHGVGSTEADVMMQLSDAFATGDAQQMEGTMQREANIRENVDPRALIRKALTRLRGKLISPIEKLGQDVHQAVGQAFENVVDDMLGRAVISASKEGSDMFARALSSSEGQDALKRAFAADNDFLSSDFARSAGGRTLGERLSGVTSFLGGSRTPMAQRHFMGQAFGGQNGVRSNLLRLATGGARAGSGVSDIIREIQGNAGNFGTMSPIEQQEALAAGLRDTLGALETGIGAHMDPMKLSESQLRSFEKMGGGQARAARLVREMQKTGAATSDAAMLEVSVGGGGMSARSVLGLSGGFTAGDPARRAKIRREAIDILNSSGAKFSGDEIVALQGNASMRKALSMALADSGLGSVLLRGDADEISARLESRGVKLSKEDVSTLISAYSKASKTSGFGALSFSRDENGNFVSADQNSLRDNLLSALSKLDNAAMGESLDVARDVAGKAADELTAGAASLTSAHRKDLARQVSSVADAFKRFNSGDAGGIDDARSAINRLSTTLANIHDPEQREQIAGKLGHVGRLLMVRSRLQGLGKGNEAEILRAAGLTGDATATDLLDSRGFGAGASRKLSGDLIDRLTNLSIAKHLLPAKATGAEADSSDPLLRTLTKMDQNQARLATVLVGLMPDANDTQKKAAHSAATAALESTKAVPGQ